MRKYHIINFTRKCCHHKQNCNKHFHFYQIFPSRLKKTYEMKTVKSIFRSTQKILLSIWSKIMLHSHTLFGDKKCIMYCLRIYLLYYTQFSQQTVSSLKDFSCCTYFSSLALIYSIDNVCRTARIWRYKHINANC